MSHEDRFKETVDTYYIMSLAMSKFKSVIYYDCVPSGVHYGFTNYELVAVNPPYKLQLGVL